MMRRWQHGPLAMEIERRSLGTVVRVPNQGALLRLRLLVGDEEMAAAVVKVYRIGGAAHIHMIRNQMDRFVGTVLATREKPFIAEVMEVLRSLPALVVGPYAIGNVRGDLPRAIRAIGPGEEIPDGYEVVRTVINPRTGEATRHLRKSGPLPN